MDWSKRHRRYDMSAAEWVTLVPNELDIDAVGLCQVIPVGRHEFGLDGEDLETFTRKALKGLLAKGAIPITGRGQSWVAEHKYGTGPEEIIETVVKIWLSKDMRDPDVGDVWFGTTAVLEE
ncbi:hypothetical protein EN828_08985 [Mesorhizobium sp. M2D.F.Ca.ET.185.01.1.1]|uniref:hypothetical protein n=1 Tax=unclassified Mesorhizobium TaxID=325217 RepID=UPI000FCC9A7C|nr:MULTISPECIES: hypothetical protein [unclassified Mesorhizobium]TGP82709.1 hypothetical protein EN870_05530 [bacterium M00.F.Ca.ET.227.01.1.1]TGP94463.1 hypothetical protein EN864_13500 [bacterium M00.F.Ca.ET.221.01.1.1]TGP97916.1 hypothetical protein EN865_09725 [bacterium M00.F.Ca.ET.222.01.1.1]TGT74985.1 hypothetical protein EN802_08185 [bacterium M00.F.Ca.ET.159.01.1.1]TGT87852.1 hypothetical protein EN800_05075 [bacterium M00.F.Ca.ET.157.01.1.1]TGU11772.1 hypothetical protein EN806_198